MAPQQLYQWRLSQLAATTFANVCFGMVTSVLGPLAPKLAQQCDVEVGRFGAIYLLALLSIPCSPLVGLLLDKFPRRGHLMMAVSLCLMSVGSCAAVRAAEAQSILFVAGAWLINQVGFSILGTAGNALASFAWEPNPAGALNVANTAFGIGSIAGPQLAQFFGVRSLSFIACVCLLAALPFILLPTPLPPHMQFGEEGRSDGAVVDNTKPVAAELSVDSGAKVAPKQVVLAVVLPSLGVMFFSVGVECAFGQWLFVYADTVLGLGPLPSARLASLFWTAFTVTRVIASVFAFHIEPLVFMAMSVPVLVASFTVMTFSQSHLVVYCMVVCVGVGIATPFASAIGVLQRFSLLTGGVQGWIGAAAGAGAAVLPGFVGWLAEPTASHASGALFLMPSFLLACCVCIGAFTLCTVKLGGRAAQARAASFDPLLG